MRTSLVAVIYLIVSLAALQSSKACQDEPPDGPKRIFKDDLIENLAATGSSRARFAVRKSRTPSRRSGF